MAGETTTRAGIDIDYIPHAQGPILNAQNWALELTTAQLELNDVLQLGYIPTGATLLGFFAYADDLDSSGSPALAWKITVGATDVKTGITIGQATSVSTHSITQFLGIEPITMTAPTLVSVTFTTAAATAAAGGFSLIPVYIGG
jgi:hypothetical protein